MNVIWCVDSICIVISSSLNHRLKEKKRKGEFGQEEKIMKRIRCCVIGVFGSSWMYSCVKHEKRVNVWIRREWWWKSGRQGEKGGRKRGEKREKGKSGFGKSPFLFLLTVSLPLPFFPCIHHTTTPQHAHTLTHHTPYNMTHWCTPSHANRAMCCAVFRFTFFVGFCRLTSQQWSTRTIFKWQWIGGDWFRINKMQNVWWWWAKRDERESVLLVASLVRGHLSDSHPCHLAHTHHNQRSSLRVMEWFECRMHITCFHLVVTSIVCIHQECWLHVHGTWQSAHKNPKTQKRFYIENVLIEYESFKLFLWFWFFSWLWVNDCFFWRFFPLLIDWDQPLWGTGPFVYNNCFRHIATFDKEDNLFIAAFTPFQFFFNPESLIGNPKGDEHGVQPFHIILIFLHYSCVLQWKREMRMSRRRLYSLIDHIFFDLKPIWSLRPIWLFVLTNVLLSLIRKPWKMTESSLTSSSGLLSLWTENKDNSLRNLIWIFFWNRVFWYQTLLLSIDAFTIRVCDCSTCEDCQVDEWCCNLMF